MLFNYLTGYSQTQSGSAVHWVVEELPAETMLLVK